MGQNGKNGSNNGKISPQMVIDQFNVVLAQKEEERCKTLDNFSNWAYKDGQSPEYVNAIMVQGFECFGKESQEILKKHMPFHILRAINDHNFYEAKENLY